MMVIRMLWLKRRILFTFFLIVLPQLTAVYLMYYLYITTPELQRMWRPIRPRPSPDVDYLAALRSRADASGFVVLAMVDESFVDMAANLYEYSFRRRGIDNFLFVGVGGKTCLLLANMSLPCFTYTDDENASTASNYGSREFVRKMNIRTAMIIDALAGNLTVLHTDVDVAFINNPLPELKELLNTAHIAAMWDHGVYNAGFIVVRPSWLTRLVYEKMWLLTETDPAVDDQTALNNAIQEIRLAQRRVGSRSLIRNDDRWIGVSMSTVIVSLDKSRFVCGVDYFEKPPTRIFQFSGAEWNPTDICGGGSVSPRYRKFRPCADVVHNNWIVGKSAKIFRFREHLMWLHDPNGTYYGGRDAKYLMYQSVAGQHERSHSEQSQSTDIDAQLVELKTALAFGYLLNRTVILKRFRCDVLNKKSPSSHVTSSIAECPLNALLDVASFDRQFAGRYRESSFLKNGRVPGEVRYGLSIVQRCRTRSAITVTITGRPNDDGERRSATTKYPRRQTSGDIVRSFRAFEDRVLVFESFTDDECFPSFDDRSDGEQFEIKLKLGFVRNDYRQLQHPSLGEMTNTTEVTSRLAKT